jgi:hypothetical protein
LISSSIKKTASNCEEININSTKTVLIDLVNIEKLSLNEVSNTSSQKFKKILIITHGGFIMELSNVIRNKRQLKILNKNDITNTALSIIRIYCPNCGEVCSNQLNCLSLEYDFIIYNDNSHCKDL